MTWILSRMVNFARMVPANPPSQNFYSMFREAVTAQEVRTGMEKSHHLTAALYFGMAALEAFLNQKMREHLTPTSAEKEIRTRLRDGKIKDKLKKWPEEILGKPVAIERRTWNLIVFFNRLRGDLTHPKTHGQDLYDELEQRVQATAIVDSVAEYIVRYHETEGRRYPYWVFGWSYFNPRQDSYDFLPMNEQQFCFSLQALGFNAQATDEWMDAYFRTFGGYEKIKKALDSSDRCEPKAALFPFRPTLCRRWWTPDHQQTCGHITEEALRRARELGGRRKGAQ